MEDDDCVVGHSTQLQRILDTTDLIIHRRDHRRIKPAVRVGDLLVTIDILLRRLVRRVWCGEGHIHKQRIFRIMAIDQSQRILADERGDISLFIDNAAIPVPVGFASHFVREIIDLPDLTAILIIETSLHRHMSLLA